MEESATDRGHLGTEVLMLAQTSEEEDEGALSVRADDNVLIDRKHFKKLYIYIYLIIILA